MRPNPGVLVCLFLLCLALGTIGCGFNNEPVPQVYVQAGERYYHRSGCPLLIESEARPCRKSEALDRGYQPCPKCQEYVPREDYDRLCRRVEELEQRLQEQELRQERYTEQLAEQQRRWQEQYDAARLAQQQWQSQREYEAQQRAEQQRLERQAEITEQRRANDYAKCNPVRRVITSETVIQDALKRARQESAIQEELARAEWLRRQARRSPYRTTRYTRAIKP